MDCTGIQILPVHRQDNSYFLKAPTAPALHQPGQDRLRYLVSMLWTGAMRHRACNSALVQICERRRITSSPVDKSCLLAYTRCSKSKMLSLPVFGPLLRCAANNLFVPAPMLLNDKFNKIYPPPVSCRKLLPLIQLLRGLWFTYWKTTGSALSGGLPRTWAYAYLMKEIILWGKKVCRTIYCYLLVCSISLAAWMRTHGPAFQVHKITLP